MNNLKRLWGIYSCWCGFYEAHDDFLIAEGRLKKLREVDQTHNWYMVAMVEEKPFGGDNY